MPLHLLVLDAYPVEGREALRHAGGTEAGLLYERLLRRIEPDARLDRAHPADPGPLLPMGVTLERYDGVVWTGSSLTIHARNDARVERQLELARACFERGVPAFGSCWAAQVASVAAGGRCGPSPRGREFGVSRRITLSPAGLAHPMYRGKPATFEAFTSHADEIIELPEGIPALASNEWSSVQALAVEHGRASFWAVQYHPEYDPYEVARLAYLRAEELVRQGSFANRERLDGFVQDMEALHADPSRDDLAARHDVPRELLAKETAETELRNWLAEKAHARRRGRS